VGVALAVWVIASPVLDVDLRATMGSDPVQEIGPAAVLGASLVVSLAAWAFLALLERLTMRARTVWTASAAIVLLVSLTPPLSFGVTAAAKTALVVMHVAVGAVLILTLPRPALGSRGQW